MQRQYQEVLGAAGPALAARRAAEGEDWRGHRLVAANRALPVEVLRNT